MTIPIVQNHRFVDMTGKVIGRLTVIRFSECRDGKAFWICRCECGNEKEIYGAKLRNGYNRSCGCMVRVKTIERNLSHGLTYTPEYAVWSGMKARCHYPKHQFYHLYGGRGINVCESWSNSFDAFIRDMGPRPSPKHSIERIDRNGDYCPSNCKWASREEQARNRENNRLITFNGETLVMCDWAKRFGLKSLTVRARLARGWSVEEALTTPLKSAKDKRRRVSLGTPS